MARSGTRSLVLEVAASTTKLDAGVKAARSTLAQLGGDFTKLEQVADQAFADLGGDGAARSARQIESEFNRMFRSVARNAKAIKAESSQDFALQLFDVGAADQEIVALRQQAGYLRELSARAKEAALSGGEFAQKQGEIATQAYLAAKQIEQQALDLDEAATAWRQLGPSIDKAKSATSASVAVNGAQRAGLQQLSYQLGDVATMYSLGAKPQQIFASQGTQVIQALQLMSGESKGLLAVLGGPWGIVFAAALTVLAPFVGKLWEGEEAMKAVELAGNGMSSAQSTLSQMFDTTTGAIKSQNAQLRLNAQLLAINLRAEAAAARSTANEGAKNAGQMSWGAVWRGNVPLRKAFETRDTVARSKLLGILNAGTADEASTNALAAAKWAETANFSNVDISRQDYLDAIARAAEVRAKQDTAGKIESSLANNKLDPAFINPAKSNKSAGKEAERAAKEALQRQRSLQDAQAQADQSILGALLKRADNEDQRLALQLMQLSSEREQRNLAIDRQVTDKEITAADAAELKAKWAAVDRLDEDALRAEARQKKLDQAAEVDRAELNGKIDVLRLQSQLADTLEQRRRIAQQILGYQLEERRQEAQRLLASKNPAEQAQGRAIMAGLSVERAAGQKSIDSQFADPVEQYMQRLQDAAGNTEEALNRVRADGLQNLEDGLVGVITGTESVASAFKKMANQIIADLVRIAVEKLILNSVSGGVFSFLGFKDGGPVQQKAGGGMISGPGSATSDSIPAMLSNGEFVVNAQATAANLPLLQAINENRVLKFASGGMVPRLPSLPPLATIRSSSGPTQVQQHFHVDARGSVLAAQLVDEMRRIGATAAVGGSQLAQQDLAEQQLSTMP